MPNAFNLPQRIHVGQPIEPLLNRILQALHGLTNVHMPKGLTVRLDASGFYVAGTLATDGDSTTTNVALTAHGHESAFDGSRARSGAIGGVT